MDMTEGQMAAASLKPILNKYGIDDISIISRASYEGKGILQALGERLIAVHDLLLSCKWHAPYNFLPVGIEMDARMLSAGEGRQWTVEELLAVGSRVITLERAFQSREGITREHDTLPKRLFTRPLPGHWPDEVLDHQKFEQMKDEYYETVGWDLKTGIPTRETLNSLKLSDVADDLDKRGKLPQEEKVPKSESISRKVKK